METEATYAMDGLYIGLTIIFILLNGFFVAAEFALVKIRETQLDSMIVDKKPFSNTAMWLYKRLNLALSACQLGITMASIALGWIGEPAIAHLIRPLIIGIGITSTTLIHAIAFIIAFTIITSLHIVIGEQVPKIYAIRKPGSVLLSTAVILRGFYILLYPFMFILNGITSVILGWMGIKNPDSHEMSLTEEEIKGTLNISLAKGELTKNEHNLLNAVFKFDDESTGQIMIPRNEVEFLDINDDIKESTHKVKESRHSRFPLCDGSLDKLLGVVHIKDLYRTSGNDSSELIKIARAPRLVPKNMLLSKLLHEFRARRQHLAFVQDEYGTILGIVTLEDVLEELVGELQDEFDNDLPDIITEENGKYIVDGDALIDDINSRLKTHLISSEANTLSGLIVERFGHNLRQGKVIQLGQGVEAELVKIEGIRVTKIRLTIPFNENK